MVLRREKENRELARRWQEDQRRIQRMEDPDDYYGDFKDFNVRRRFIRRVFYILTLQLIFTALVIAIVIFVPEVREFVMMNPILFICALVVFLFTYISISCCEYARREMPCNIINLILLTVSCSYLTAAGCIYYTFEALLLAASVTALISLIICCVATCTKFDLTKYNGLVCIVSLLILIAMIIMSIVLMYTKLKVIHAILALIGAGLWSMYMFYDLQTIMGGRRIELSSDEVVYATTQLYVDVIYLYRMILMLTGIGIYD